MKVINNTNINTDRLFKLYEKELSLILLSRHVFKIVFDSCRCIIYRNDGEVLYEVDERSDRYKDTLN